MSRPFLWVAAVALVLVGCRTVPVSLPPLQPWLQRKAALQARQHFELSGRVAVAAGSQGFNAHLRWVQNGEQAQVSLEGPLGTGGLQVTANGPHVSVITSRGEHLDDAAARQELTSRLGFEPPLASLRYWILGVPDPNEPASETLDAHHLLSRLTQMGWQIDYTGYVPVNSQPLPARLTLTSADVRVRVIVDRWSAM